MDEKLKAFWAKLNSDVADLWEHNKLFLIVFGVLILVIKFHSVLMDLIVADSKNIFKDAGKESSALQAQENSNNAQADKLVADAKTLSEEKPSVSDDWNTKK